MGIRKVDFKDGGLVTVGQLKIGQLAEVVCSPDPEHIGLVGQVCRFDSNFIGIGGDLYWSRGVEIKLRILPNGTKLEVFDNE